MSVLLPFFLLTPTSGQKAGIPQETMVIERIGLFPAVAATFPIAAYNTYPCQKIIPHRGAYHLSFI